MDPAHIPLKVILCSLRLTPPTYQGFVLFQGLVEGTDSDKEQDDCDVLKHVNPLLPLALLTCHVNHPGNHVNTT